MNKLLELIEAHMLSVNDRDLLPWQRARQRDRAREFSEQLRSMADAIDRTHIDDGK